MTKNEFQRLHSSMDSLINARTMYTLMRALYDTPQYNPDFDEIRDMFSDGQIVSKQWLIRNAFQDISLDNKILIVGGWYGLLAKMINEYDYCQYVHTTDMDPRCKTIFDNSWANDKISASTNNMFDIDYHNHNFDIIVNTSMEHLTDPSNWLRLLPAGQKVVLQSNNYDAIDDHVSCVKSVGEFVKQTKLSNVTFADELVFPMYTRYMIIGTV